MRLSFISPQAARMALILIGAWVCTPVSAIAKPVFLEWTPIQHATRYEIRIGKTSEATAHRDVTRNEFRTDLDPGVYFWQVRAVDRLKRPGKWSDQQLLVVMPAPPRLIAPASTSEIHVYHANAMTRFEWETSRGSDAYVFELRRNGESVTRRKLSETSLELERLPPGEYTWSVRSTVSTDQTVPALFQSRNWESRETSAYHFRLNRKALEQARLQEPVGIVSLPESRELQFKWTSVEGASSYEIRIHAPPLERTYRSEGTSLQVNLSDLGSISEGQEYSWEVRPLPTRAPASVSDEPSSAQVSSAKFRFSTETRDLYRVTAVELSTMASITRYRFSAPDAGHTGVNEATTAGLRLAASHYPSPSSNLGFGGAIENTILQISDEKYTLKSSHLAARYRAPLRAWGPGWLFQARSGVGYHQYLEVFPLVRVNTLSRTVTVLGTDHMTISTLGPATGVELKHYFSSQWSGQLAVSHFLPLMKAGSTQAGTLQSSGVLDNTSATLQWAWESRAWSFHLGLSNERRSVRFNRVLSDGTISSRTDEAASAAWSFQAGLSYSLY